MGLIRVHLSEPDKVAVEDEQSQHAAHGYLINQAPSLENNRRTDEYGGSLDHRARFLFEAAEYRDHRQHDWQPAASSYSNALMSLSRLSGLVVGA